MSTCTPAASFVLCLAMTLLVHAAIWAVIAFGLVWLVQDKLRKDRTGICKTLSGSFRNRWSSADRL